MRIAVFSTKPYDRRFFESANAEFGHELHFFEPRLTHETLPLATGFPGVCVFVNDVLDATVLQQLANEGLRLVALRCAGFNNVDVPTADRLGVTVVRVPAYSPHAVAEHTVGMMLSLNRKLHRAYGRVREGNFALDGLLGFDMNGRTVGLIGTGKIGLVTAGILKGFGYHILAYDLYPNDQLTAMGGQYVDLPEIYAEADIISVHCPLTAETHHLIDERAVNQMKPGVMLVNTSRGAIIDTRAAIEGLKSGKIGALGIDVYEEESELFFEDHSDRVLIDDVFARLLTFPNVLITGHQAFFTREALEQIARTTLSNVTLVDQDAPCPNQVTLG
ncbi:MAG: 2-hydroxyacid dehydrogenase [Planctomycetales bacterium]|nr:2-hydroxyacid dehydrogenase [Planctomycetales bacterium]